MIGWPELSPPKQLDQSKKKLTKFFYTHFLMEIAFEKTNTAKNSTSFFNTEKFFTKSNFLLTQILDF